ncbi:MULTISPECIES: response regulator [Paraburkholderia]|jgi:DNA-binding NarL/FixJ family response regulator|uniref:Response regulator receiver domain-containing protein n=1 Tax=Paraburkholderia phenazinium TaxID=60549 RepID=A0A1N6FY69_9BURK|nr:response regulator [Paraburkholderia phenazinium]SIO00255.1 Response regulator receiver domain-containing protein [Paraburkholderia phenazinium]
MSSDSISPDSAGQPPLRVLLIEDSALIRRSIVEAIDASGMLHVAAFADTSDEAIALLTGESFDAVIIDLQLKHGSGVPVLAYLQREGLIDRTFAAVLTNHALPAYRERCLQYGVRHFFDKSFEFDRVIDALHDYAQTRRDG